MNTPLPNASRFWRALFIACLVLCPSARAQESLAHQDVFRTHQPAIESAVAKALRYLASTQAPDGTYPDSYGRSVGVVSLVGMAYLSAGHTPGYGEYADGA